MKKFILAWFILGTMALAQDEEYRNEVRVGGGNFLPAGHASSFAFQAGYVMASGSSVIGIDLQIKKTEADIINAKDVDVVSFYVPFHYGYISRTGKVRPYIAGGINLGIIGIDETEWKSKTPGLIVEKSVAYSYGLLGIAGVTLQASNELAFFLEYRHSFDYFYVTVASLGDEFVGIGGGFVHVGIGFSISRSLD